MNKEKRNIICTVLNILDEQLNILEHKIKTNKSIKDITGQINLIRITIPKPGDILTTPISKFVK